MCIWRRVVPGLLLTLCALIDSASGEDAGAVPRSWAYRHTPDPEFSRVQTPSLQLPLADPVAFLERHEAVLGHNARNVINIAPEGWKEEDVVSKGVWHLLADGTCMWSLSIVTRGAYSHVVVFSELSIPWGGEFSIFSPSETRNRTRCGHSCMRVTPTRILSRKLTSLAMDGEEVVLEYHHPAPFPPEGGFVAKIASVLQGLPGSLPEAADLNRRRRLLGRSEDPGYTPGSGFDMSVLQRKDDVISQCTQSVRCDDRVGEVDDAIVDIYAINLQLGAMAVCTGTLITAPLNRMYLLTADHCFVDKKAINNFEYWVLIFNYEVPCGGTDPPDFKQVIQGVRLMFYDSKADVLLLSLTATIPDKFKPYLLGYDASADAVPRRAIGIHHPNGSVKRISYANDSNSISANFVARRFPSGEVQPSNATHFQVLWSSGATASGSSGSPLIDVDSRKVVGVLTGGFASCQDRTGPDYYGRLSAAFSNGLEHFLSNQPGDKVDDVAEILETVTNGGEIVVRTMNGTAIPKHGPALGMYPSYLTFDTSHFQSSFTYFLTDPLPWDNETIFMDVSVRGTYPGNVFDMTPYIELSDVSDNFTSSDIYEYRRSIRVSLRGLESVRAAPGNLARFQLIFKLTSDVNPNYYHLHTLKGILVASRGPWSQYRALTMHCEELPCFFDQPGRDQNSTDFIYGRYSKEVADKYDTPTLAMFSFTPDRHVQAQLDICLEPDILRGATVSVYVDMKFTWTIGTDPFGDPNCVHISSITTQPNQTYTVVVSDEDNFDAVLPVQTVRYISVVNTDVDVITPGYSLGPVEGGTVGNVTVKTEQFPLPANAMVGSPLPAPVPVSAPAPQGGEVIARVRNKSLVPAHAPVPLPAIRIVEASPRKAKGAATQADQEAAPAARPPMPSQAQILPAPAPGPLSGSPNSSQDPMQKAPATMTATPPRDAMGYISGGR